MKEVCFFFLVLVVCVLNCAVFGDMDYEARLSEIENVIRLQDEKIASQNTEISSLKNTVLSQKNEIDSLKKSLKELRIKQIRQTRTLPLLKSLIDRSHKPVTSDNHLLPNMGKNDAKRMFNNQSGIVEVPKRPSIAPPSTKDFRPINLRQNKVAPNPHVAFHAYLSHQEQSPSPHFVFVFDTVITNLHTSYNKYSGIFTAPVSGTYAFFFSMRTTCDAVQVAQLIKNSEVMGVIVVYAKACAGQMSSGSNILSLQIGDIVFVRTHETFPGSGHIESNSEGRPHFSGFLLYPDP